MPKKLAGLLLGIAVLWALNPSAERHGERFAEGFRAEHPVLTLFGADRVAPTLLTYRSYGVLSAGWVGDELVTFGAVGMVHVRGVEMERLGEEAARQGREGVRSFLEGARAGVEARE
ncbi:MAG TPA: hypothetical protein VHG51_09800 [Longimicrobiaceae bacterium]|nr:hypothetical protein [Longimicrobiaceae bacterium]